MAKVQLGALRFVFKICHASYSDLRSTAGRPLLYTERPQAILTEIFGIYLNVLPEYSRFQTWENTFRYVAPVMEYVRK